VIICNYVFPHWLFTAHEMFSKYSSLCLQSVPQRHRPVDGRLIVDNRAPR